MKLIEDYNDMPSLGFSTAAQVVITIWNRDDIVRSITQYLDMNRSINYRAWQEIARRVQTIVRSIDDIPINLARDMDALITPIGIHIKGMRRCLNLSPYIVSSDLEFSVSHWTSYGTVDTKGLEKMLVRDRRKPISFRYKLACNDCIETVIKKLYPRLTRRQKSSCQELGRNTELLCYWTHRLLDQLSFFEHLISVRDAIVGEQSYSADQIAFKFTLRAGNKSGIEYFLNYLRPEVSEIVLAQYFISLTLRPMMDMTERSYLPLRPPEHFTDALYFSIQKVSENIRREILREKPYNIWNNFLMYPFYGLFCTHAIEHVDKYTEEDIYFLIRRIFSFDQTGMHFFGYKPLKVLWDKCSETQKDYVISKTNELTELGLRDVANKLRALIEAQIN